MDFETKKIPVPDGIAEIWQRIVDSVAIFLSVPGVMINRLEPPELEIFRSNCSPDNPFPSGTKLNMDGLYCTSVALRRQKLHIDDARSDPLWSESPTAKEGIISYVGVPLLWPDGEVFGTLCAIDTSKHDWEDKAENLLQALKGAIESHLALIMTRDISDVNNEELELALREVLTLQGFTLVSSPCKDD